MSFKYFVSREGREFGPYSADELRRYVAQGRVLPSEPVREGDSSAWSTAGEIAGPIEPAPPPPPPVPPRVPSSPAVPRPPSEGNVPPRWGPPEGASPYATPATWQDLQSAPAGRSDVPDPPSLHWALLLVLSFFTCGILLLVYMFRQAAWAKRIDPESKAKSMYSIYLVMVFVGVALDRAGSPNELGPADLLALVARLAGMAFYLIGAYDLRRTIQEVTGRALGGVATFFLGTFYFQYHLMEWKASRPRY